MTIHTWLRERNIFSSIFPLTFLLSLFENKTYENSNGGINRIRFADNLKRVVFVQCDFRIWKFCPFSFMVRSFIRLHVWLSSLFLFIASTFAWLTAPISIANFWNANGLKNPARVHGHFHSSIVENLPNFRNFTFRIWTRSNRVNVHSKTFNSVRFNETINFKEKLPLLNVMILR